MVVLHASKWYHHINSPCECSICPIISEHCFDLICKFDAIFVGVGVECCFTALFDSNQFSNCYIHVYEKEARSRLFKMQDLPLTYMFEYHRFEFQPNWAWYWYQFTLNSVIISGSEVPGGAEHVLVHSETHALQWL